MILDPVLDPPNSVNALIIRLQRLAGLSIEQVAQFCQQIVPNDLLKNKGWVGQLIELALGAQSGSLAQPDFPHLGIELKTLPLNSQGKPKESTYVSVAPLTDLSGVSYENSSVGKKLNHVLWIPVEADNNIPLAKRRIGQGFLWQPNDQERALLSKDFSEIIEKISMGEVESITAHEGEALQLRPKAANARALTQAVGPEGELMMTLPRGFYLRPSFTRQLLQRYFEQKQEVI